MRWRLALTLAILTTPASAGTYLDANGNQWYLVDPPAYWLDQPLPADTTVLFVPPHRVVGYCTVNPRREETLGCAIVYEDQDKCVVRVNEDLPYEFREAVKRHELAHCAGWPENHPTTPPYAVQRQQLKEALEQQARENFEAERAPTNIPLSDETLTILDRYVFGD